MMRQNNIADRDLLLPRTILRRLFDVAVETADPMHFVPSHLPVRPQGRILVVGAGKASARMAEAVEKVWGLCEGIVITRYGYTRPCQSIRVLEASHPVPDTNGQKATEELLRLLESADNDTFVLVLISGGASALLTRPLDGISLAEKQSITRQLLDSGAPIQDINAVRTVLSSIKGGKLVAVAHPAKILTLIMSDVTGDDPALIGSGPTVPSNVMMSDVLECLRKWNVEVPPHINAVLAHQPSCLNMLTVPNLRLENRVVAAPMQSLSAAAHMAREFGMDVIELGDGVEGEASAVGRKHAELARELQNKMNPTGRPIVVLSGGELTVTRKGDGIGGPNAEYALSLACTLDGACGISAIACDTDGVDGADEVAGAFVFPDTLERALQLNMRGEAFLSNNDSHSFFKALSDQVVTGPTLTNVNDFRAILIKPSPVHGLTR
jgi:glycerate 2-kinase